MSNGYGLMMCRRNKRLEQKACIPFAFIINFYPIKELSLRTAVLKDSGVLKNVAVPPGYENGSMHNRDRFSFRPRD
jgi:hypothetical protein